MKTSDHVSMQEYATVRIVRLVEYKVVALHN